MTYERTLLEVDKDNQGWTLNATPVKTSYGKVRLNSQGQKCWDRSMTDCSFSASSNWGEK